MSGAQTSTFADPNILYKTLSGAGMQEVEQNRLLNVQRQQDIAANNTEVVARAASALIDPSLYPTEEARAAAYGPIIKRLKADGYAPNAPDYYPGFQHLQLTARLGTPSADLFKQQQNQAGWGQITGDGTTATGTGGGGGGGGGGTGTVGGADTAPINAAGDSRTRKAAEGGPPAAGSPGAAVAQRTHDFWISKGYSEAQVAGIMAGGPGSESNFTPTVFGDKGTSYGQYQHHGPRLDAMRQFFGLSGSQMPSEDQQNQYAHWEITQGPLKNVGEMLKNAKTPEEAASIWTQYFGVPADKSEIGRRAAGARRFVGLYGQPQQGGQGGATAAAAAPGVQMGGAAPPPPGGAPGTYPGSGGGMGAVIGGRPAAVSGTPIPAGRPTGPPVVTDQPAGGGVVAGPPGPAVVGQPVPASPAVAGNVDAINAGIVRGGGQPVTDPNATPTPARYAGTAPAPSVEAAPQPGWGTGIGSGYGPQNALAPSPPAPTQPAAPVVAQQQPPAPVQPAARPAAAPAAGGLLAGLAPDQVQAVLALRRANGTPAQGLAMIEHFKEVNASAAHQTLEEQRQQEQLRIQQQQEQRATRKEADDIAERARVAARQAEEDRRAAETQRLAQEQAKREQQKFEQGSDAHDRNVYNVTHLDPADQKYADSWSALKWETAPNGNVIEHDVSMYPAPARSVQRPSFLPAPTPQGLDEVRKVDTDAKVITSAIDHYVEVFKATGGGTWGAYFDNPRSDQAQKLNGAFIPLKTFMRSPAFFNTGVLQPAEMEALKQDLSSPQSLRGLFATPEALATRLGEIKLGVLNKQDAERRSIGQDGIIVRDKADYNKVPTGGRYYDENGDLKVKQ